MQEAQEDGMADKVGASFVTLFSEEWDKTMGELQEIFGSVASIKKFFFNKEKTQQGAVLHSRICGWNRGEMATSLLERIPFVWGTVFNEYLSMRLEAPGRQAGANAPLRLKHLS